MTLSPLHRTKRLPLTLLVLLTGVTLAGGVSHVLESPIRQNDYLHEHLNVSGLNVAATWSRVDGVLPNQTRDRLARMVMATERPDWMPNVDSPLMGQALTHATSKYCHYEVQACSFTVSLGREFTETQANRDFRVVNIQETSLRVDIDTDPELSAVNVVEISEETRLFRFYQTQAGWMQKTSEVIDKKPLDFENREQRLAPKFATNFVGLNYYPASSSWKEFWVDFPVSEIDSDLTKMKSLNVNSVRIFLNHEYFNDLETREDAKIKLNTFLNLCDESNITVLITLFDLRPYYALSNLDNDLSHIDQILKPIKDHPSILGVDIKNQADLDFGNWGEGLVEGWVTIMARHIQRVYPDLAVTVGWSTPENATRLNDVVDFVTYHEYGNPQGFAERLKTIKSSVGTKPVMITELGSTTWRPFLSVKNAEDKQATRLSTQLSQANEAQGVFVWTLNDFDHVGSDVVGKRPWRQAQQKHFGLLRADGTARPSKGVLQAYGATRVTASHPTK